jgi:uncharacterized membrane-anchored protein YhcB (DUF1043 family)
MNRYIFLDIETQQSFDDVGGHYPENLNMSLAVTFDYQSLYKHWNEDDISSLIEYLNKFNFVIGYNLLEFDYKVLGSYQQTDDDVKEELENKTIDLLALIEEEIGKRISLDEIAKATLNKKKSGNGLKAIKFWQAGEIEKLKRYCEDDVKLTVNLFEFIQKNRCLYYTSYGDKEEISITLPEAAERVELNIENFKTELNAYFEVLFAGETISRNQIKLLKDKFDILIDHIENSTQDIIEDNNDEDDDDEEDDDDYNPNPIKDEIKYNAPKPYLGGMSDAADDLPF